ncbi:hypothetical protein ACFQ1E_04525 [Sphingomonas canadensis]|uniref:Uncharacterized protein n=1 Tax=Sphingomonas canadensis TaxID=1219257 RepID=A0ABW3H4K6_9SPHN|nr:hypothetical protein [Sphingomonas canadensis]MCW3834495.1 hypothetical protein [Sphingomonas canadensis]
MNERAAPKPLGKAHSNIVAEQFKALGWTLTHEFRADGDGEPYEYLFEWQREGEPAYPAR